MEIKCVAVDDEPLALELIRTYVERHPALRLAQTFTDALAAREYLRTEGPDLLFVDINMPDITGLDLVRSLDPRPPVIFTTAYRKFAVDAYDLDAIDYLVKPIEPARFERAVAKALEYIRFRQAPPQAEPSALFVRSEYQLVKIDTANIRYVESLEDYSRFHLREGRPVMTLMTLKTVLEKLPPGGFLRIHRSYIVPVAGIQSVSNRKVRLAGIELPVGESYLPGLQAWMKK